MTKKTQQKDSLKELGVKPLIVSEINKIRGHYITDGNIWCIDETFFNSQFCVFLVVTLKTRAILGFIISPLHPITDDDIIELYSLILDNYEEKNFPLCIHSDAAPKYKSKKLIKFLTDKGIETSQTVAEARENQVIEGINDRIKALTSQFLIEKDSRARRAFYLTLPLQFKGQKVHTKVRDKEFRNLLFNSRLFKEKGSDKVKRAILEYNNAYYFQDITREQAEYLNTRIKQPDIKSVVLVSSKSPIAKTIEDINKTDIAAVDRKLKEIISSTQLSNEQKIEQLLQFEMYGQSYIKHILTYGFTLLMQQAESNRNDIKQDLKQQNQQLQTQIQEYATIMQDLRQEIYNLTDQLQEERRARSEKEEVKKKRLNRARLPEREPMTEKIYQALIQTTPNHTYIHARLRIAMVLLCITGVRIGELLPIKVFQIQTLFSDGWIAIDRSKRGPASYKAFLNKKGQQLLNERKTDFEYICAAKFNDPNALVFSPMNKHKTPLRRDTFTKQVNSILNEVSLNIEGNPNIKSHSFRKGFITQLWRDTGDIEYVRQVIGHTNVDTTSKYVTRLSESERAEKMRNITNSTDFVQSSIQIDLIDHD